MDVIMFCLALGGIDNGADRKSFCADQLCSLPHRLPYVKAS